MKVLKRDKTVENFDFSKIANAISLAYASCRKDCNDDVLECMKAKYDVTSDKKVKVEDIQDEVEKCLMAYDSDVAKSYIIYRYEHKLFRDNKNKFAKQVKKKLTAEDVQNQNANVDEFSFGGRIGEASRVVTKEYVWKTVCPRNQEKIMKIMKFISIS